MNRFIPYIILLVAALWLGASWRDPKPKPDDFDLRAFSRLPVLVGGRVKPLDTVARNALLILRGKQTLWLPDATNKKPATGIARWLEKNGVVMPAGTSMTASRWLAAVLFDAPVADTYPVFAIANPEVLGMFGWPQVDKKYASFTELQPYLAKIDEEGKLTAETDAKERSPFQTAIYNLRNSLVLYQSLKNSIHPEDSTHFGAEINTYATTVAASAAALSQNNTPPTKEQVALLNAAVTRYESQAQIAYMLTVPPPAGGKPSAWLSTGAALIRVDSPQSLPLAVTSYAKLSDAFRDADPAAFTQAAEAYADTLERDHRDWSGRCAYELRFNLMEPFYQSMVLYIGAFLLACGSWLVCPKGMRKTAFLLLMLALAAHSFGMFSRMYLQGRPPVTNLYSSAIFVGWGAVVLGLVLERIFRDGIGAACAGMVGFITLIIAHHLGANGDTLEMMQAVLDSNIWLATHVVIITAGYSAMFLAGFLAIFYVLLALLTSGHDRLVLVKRAAMIVVPVGALFLIALMVGKLVPTSAPASVQSVFQQVNAFMWMALCATVFVIAISYGLVIVLDVLGLRRKLVANQSKDLARNLARMVYGIVCFATLFSFVGTVLGGIWADQSWGRFWGWDPKENGALLIVLWCALILHARWGGMIRQRGLIAMAIFGNAITAFSWFGVNMLGVGLHSYGFMDKAFPWLVTFVVAQGVLIIITLQPAANHRKLPA
ncbi:MAG: cytochrome c biogenesis protein CcsA [Verrucomicrobiota bacterium]